jgi:polysaccharide export outer membrane protein
MTRKFLVIALSLACISCASTSNINETSQVPQTSSAKLDVVEYKISIGDLLEFRVYGEDSLTRSVRVSDRGLISLPLLNQVQAAGLSKEELEADLTNRIAVYYVSNPSVTINIMEFTSQRVTVEGEVRTPGVFPIRGKTSLLQAIATAQGLSPIASSSIKVLRYNSNGTRQTVVYDLDAIRNGNVVDPLVQNDDIVQVPSDSGKALAQGLINFILPFRAVATSGN